jgi:hypothetical protein
MVAAEVAHPQSGRLVMARRGCLPARKRVCDPQSIRSPRSMVNTDTHAPTVTIPEPSLGVQLETIRITASVPE